MEQVKFVEDSQKFELTWSSTNFAWFILEYFVPYNSCIMIYDDYDGYNQFILYQADIEFI